MGQSTRNDRPSKKSLESLKIKNEWGLMTARSLNKSTVDDKLSIRESCLLCEDLFLI
jgi:hypothetical protein